MVTLGKPQRQHRILRVLEDQPVSSQAQLVQLLEAEGVVATQATVSRDLEELGAVKVRIPGGAMAYAIPDGNRERAPSDDHLQAAAGRVRRRGLVQRQSRRVAHAAGQRARGRVGDRPVVDARYVGHGRRRRHDPRGLHRAGGRQRRSPRASPPSPASDQKK